ncbi:MAG: dTDP-4-dehydrorhamnose 3,5-epimerase [Clostridia bacterium]|nr:dTDP-4-dehydrorhamnose 3,5-epimerase [Clostridia bacterium]
MELIKTELKDAFIVMPKVFGDNRGWFCESYNKKAFEEIGITDIFVQDNKSFSAKKGTLRGLHCQKNPDAQVKLVSCIQGAVNDVIVDIRHGSPTFMKHIIVELSSQNNRMLYVPAGFLHGFVSLTDDVILSYKVDKFYSPENDRSVRFDDPAFAIDWGNYDLTLSEKDIKAPLFADSDIFFDYNNETAFSF